MHKSQRVAKAHYSRPHFCTTRICICLKKTLFLFGHFMVKLNKTRFRKKMHWLKTPIFYLLILSFALLFSGSAKALSIEDMRFGVHPDKIRLVLDLTENTPFKTFVLESPYRVVVDLPSSSWNVGEINRPRGSAITNVRFGAQNSNTSRLVIDVEKPVILRSAFVLPAAGEKKDRLVIDFVAVPQATFEKEKTRSFGKFESQSVLSAPPAQTLQPNTQAASQTIAMIKPPHKPNTQPKQKPLKEEEKPLIVIDPGHGGQDPGAIGKGNVLEKNVVLNTSKELKRQLEATGLYRVKLTRDTDKYIKLHRRVYMAREWGADLFISVHADSVEKGDAQGVSIYTLSNVASDAQTAKLAARENQADLIAGVDLSHEDKEVANILIDLAMRDTMNQSKFLANTMVTHMGARGLRLLKRPHRYAGFAVLKAPDIPSVLIEIGFMSNAREAAMLQTPEYQRKVAASITDGINGYFKKVKRNKRT